MNDVLTILLRIAGAGLILLAGSHVLVGRLLKWSEESDRLSPANAAIFHAHTFFICLGLVMMGLPCLIAPSIFLMPSPAGAWMDWSFAVFWLVRLYFQWFVFPWQLWRGKRRERLAHFGFTLVWILLAALFAACGSRQVGWWH